MITGRITELELYGIFSDDIKMGIDYLRSLSPDVLVGSYVVSDKIYANVMEYETHNSPNLLYEAHHNHLDIHFVISGNEKIKWSSIENLEEAIPYDEEKDAVFYQGNKVAAELTLSCDNDSFAIMFPGDGHACQYCAEKNEKIKKIVVKIKI